MSDLNRDSILFLCGFGFALSALAAIVWLVLAYKINKVVR